MKANRRSGTRVARRAPRAKNRWLIPVIGSVTPVLLIVVNIAAFIVHHLSAFQLTIAALAFVSGLMLNSYFGIGVFRMIKARSPESGLVHERNFDILIIGGMAVIIAVSAVSAWWCYQGLSSDKNLPNLSTFAFGVLSIAFPVVGREIVERVSRGRHARTDDDLLADIPAGTPPH